REPTKLVRVTRGVHQHGHERWGERSDGNVPYKAACERHLLSCRNRAREPDYGQKCQREAGCKTVAIHAFSPCGLRYIWRGRVPGAQTERRGEATRPAGDLLTGESSPAAFLSTRTVSTPSC